MRKLAAEVVGTFILVFAGTGAIVVNDVSGGAVTHVGVALTFGEWGQVFQGERMTAALLDRLTHRCHILEMNGESDRFGESMKAKKEKDPKKGK